MLVTPHHRAITWDIQQASSIGHGAECEVFDSTNLRWSSSPFPATNTLTTLTVTGSTTSWTSPLRRGTWTSDPESQAW